MPSNNSLKEFQQEINNWILSHGGYWSPFAMLLAVMEELGELAREINHLEGYKPRKYKNEEVKIGEELADTFFALTCIANYYKIDLSTELKNVIGKYSKRDSKRFI